MKSLIFTLLLLTILSCRKSENNETIQKGFITEIGTYYWGDKIIILKNIGDNSKIFGVTDDRNKIIYQQQMNIVFSNYHFWILYADENQNLYFYNSDYNESKALFWNANQNKYEERNFCNDKIILPKEFVKELKSKSTMKNCKSF